MATIQRDTTGTQGHQEKMCPSEEEAPPVLNGTTAPLNFCELTPNQFGISVQSFTPAASSKHKDKSRLAQIKARRRSNIGVRGSPETNSLIRFMAQQRMKTPPTQQTPERVMSGPFLPRVASTLKQKMASFQSLMDVEESEVCDPMPRQDRNTGGCIKTRDYLSDGNSFGGKENHPPMRMPTPKKRRYLGPLEGCKEEIGEARSPFLPFSLKKQEEDHEPATDVLTQGPLPSIETVEEAQIMLITPAPHVDSESQASCTTENQQDDVFELRSPSVPLTDNAAVASPVRPTSHINITSVPSLLEVKPTGEDESTGMSTVKKKKKVHFGGPLSPEFFDKNLPPSTPLQKGGTPARAPTPGGGLQLRSLLKTPQRSESHSPKTQPDLSSPTMFGASPVLAMPRNCRTEPVEDNEEKVGKIVFPSMEEIESEVTSDTECTLESQPVNLNAAFHEEWLSERVTASTTFEMDVPNEPAAPAEKTHPPAGPAGPAAPGLERSHNLRKKQPEPQCESTSEAPARSSSRKRKQPEESEPAKRWTRSAAKSTSGRMKVNATTTRRWNRGVDRSLYGSRAYASKNPTLSPITEKWSFARQPPPAQLTASTNCTTHEASHPETHSNPEMNDCTRSDLTVTHVVDNPSEDTSTPSNCETGVKGLSGQRVRRSRGKRKSNAAASDQLSMGPQDQTEGETVEHSEDQTTEKHTAPEQAGGDIELSAQSSSHTPTTDLNREAECNAGLNACPPSGEELNHSLDVPAEKANKEAKQSGRSSVNIPALWDQGDVVEEHQSSAEMENGHGDQAAGQPGNDSGSSSGSQEEGEAALDLAPWQTNFNFEDVFKPVTTRGQRSVRRSLRNKSNADHGNSSAGLAWMPRTSPDSSKEVRRRTRGRRLSAALPLQSSFSEETQDDAS